MECIQIMSLRNEKSERCCVRSSEFNVEFFLNVLLQNENNIQGNIFQFQYLHLKKKYIFLYR